MARQRSKLCALIFWSLLVSLFLASFALARPGDLDLAFGDGKGFVTTNVGDQRLHGDVRDDHIEDVIVLSGGRILALGGSPYGYSAARYLPDGSLDPAFGGGDGLVTGGPEPCAGRFCYTSLIEGAPQSDGRIVVGGYYDWLARLNPDGTWDQSFPKSVSYVADLDVMADDRIVGVSHAANWPTVFRLLPDGQLDHSFSGDGLIRLETPIRGRPGGVTNVYDLRVQADGKVIFSGDTARYRDGKREDRAFVRRLNLDGTRDLAFGRAGTGQITLNRRSYGGVLSVLPDHRILSVTTPLARRGYTGETLITRYRPNGVRDRSFGGGDGVTSIRIGRDYNNAGLFNQIAVQPSGRIVLSGFQGSLTRRSLLVRFHADGRRDKTFGGDGIVDRRFGESSTSRALAVYGRRRLVIGGSSTFGDQPHFLLARFRAGP
jgi:uncharacterized delta-60 repeat protein